MSVYDALKMPLQHHGFHFTVIMRSALKTNQQHRYFLVQQDFTN